MSKSKISPIGQAIVDLIEHWKVAEKSGYVNKPISYALYHTWLIWDKKETSKKYRRTKMSDTVKLMIEIPKEEYELIIGSEDCGLHPLTKAIANGKIISDKFVAVDDIVKRYLFYAEEQAGKEISQILYEVKKYSANELARRKV